MGIIVKTTEGVYGPIKNDIKQYSPRETMLFALAKYVKRGRTEIYLMPEVILLDEREASRSTGLARPSEEFQKWFYGTLIREGLLGKACRVITIHSHPFQRIASFSPIDWDSMAQDREIYGKA